MLRSALLKALQPSALGQSTGIAAASPLQRLSNTIRRAPPNTGTKLPTYLSAGTAGPAAARRAFACGRGPQACRNTARPAAQGASISRTQRRNFSWSWARKSRSGTGAGAGESLSLAARLRKLSREYGWSAVGVYLGLSVLDFPFCFLLVKWVGTERIAEIEHWVTSNIKKLIPDSVKQQWHEWRAAVKRAEMEDFGDNHISEDVEMVGWGVEEAQARHTQDASLATQLALAYAIHKSFIFIRVPLTAAVTPKVVKVLRSWGWQIGKRKPKKTKRPSTARSEARKQ